jgi:hypothetical protein
MSRKHSSPAIQSYLESGKFDAYAWPGGYPLFYLCADGGTLCPDCCDKEIELIREAANNPGTDEQWEIVAHDINYEDVSLYCDHCNNHIESAYGESNDECRWE